MPFSSVFRVLTCPPNIRQYEYVYCDVNLPYLLQGLVGAVELCVCLLEEGGPELGGVCGVEVDEPALVGGQPVVDEHLDPVAKVPEPEPEHAAVAVLEVLSAADTEVRDDSIFIECFTFFTVVEYVMRRPLFLV